MKSQGGPADGGRRMNEWRWRPGRSSAVICRGWFGWIWRRHKKKKKKQQDKAERRRESWRCVCVCATNDDDEDVSSMYNDYLAYLIVLIVVLI